VLGQVELEELAVGPVGVAVGVHRVRVRRAVLLGGEQLARVALLELDGVGAAEAGDGLDHLLGDGQLTLVVAADLGDEEGS
jgi:hypothetical protein